MKQITATKLRAELFKTLRDAARNLPTKITYKNGNAVIISFEDYVRLKLGVKSIKGKSAGSVKLKGRINEPLGEQSEESLLKYMGIK